MKKDRKLGFLAGGGEMGALMRAHDWAATPLGLPENWPQGLRTSVRLMLATRHPMFIWWGPELIQFYNDAYRQTMGPERHPSALGQPGRECWREIWDIIGPQIDLVMSGEGATWHDEALVPVTRHGKREDVWWTYGYSPIDDETQPSGIGGVLVICTDVTERRRVTNSLRDNQERLQLALDAGVVGTWDWHIPEDRVFADERFAKLYGVDPALAADGAPLSMFVSNIHPDDLERVNKAILATLKSDEVLATEYRLLQPDGSVRWVLARGYCLRDGEGRAIRLPGASIDITGRKEAEQHRELLTDELNHRVKNTLAIMQAIAVQSLRDGLSMQEARSAFLARLKAVSNAHDLLTLENWAGADLAAVIHAAVDVYAGGQGHIRIEGPTVRLTPSSALAITMAMNELATNATKYGSLSQADGRVDILWRVVEDRLQLEWTETGGPKVTPPSQRGFGSRLIQNGLATELNGEVTLAYPPSGLTCAISAPLDTIGQAK